MRQVLFHIPLKADWLPANLPAVLVPARGRAGSGRHGGLARPARPAADAQKGFCARPSGWPVSASCAAVVVYFAAPKLPHGLPIYGFGMMLFLAFLVCTWLAGRRAESEGVGREHIQDVAIWLFIGGLIGARVTFLMVEKHMGFPEMLAEIYKIWDGGIVLYGSVIGGLIGYAFAYVFIFRKYGVSTLKLADILAPLDRGGAVPGSLRLFPQRLLLWPGCLPDVPGVRGTLPAVGSGTRGDGRAGLPDAGRFHARPAATERRGVRVGKVDPYSDAYKVGLRDGDLILRVNDCDVEAREMSDSEKIIPPVGMLTHCLVSNWPRGETQLRLTVKHAKNDEAVELPTIAPRTLGLHPTQLYEVVSMVLLFLVLTAYYPLRRRPGQVMAVLMVGYGIHRSLNELLRDDPRPQGFERYTSLVLIVAGIALWVYLQTRPAPTETEGGV